MMRVNRLLLLLVALTLFVLVSNIRMPEAAANHCSRGEGTLSGSAINGKAPSGKVKWQGNAFCQPLELTVEVSNVNLPDGTVLQVDACPSGATSNIVGNITLRGGSGKLQLSKLDGDPNNDNVPFCDMRFGGSIKVMQGSTIIVSGCVSDSTGLIPGAPAC